MKNYFAIVLSIIAIAISILALCYAYPSVETLQLDYLGLIIGILALLVTVLIGAQILNAVTVRKDMTKMEDMFVELRNSCQDAVNTVHKNATERIDKGLKLVRDIANRNMEALSELILLRMNHGVVTALESAIGMIVKLKNQRGFIYESVSDAIDGFIIDIVGFNTSGETAPLVECISTIPKKRFNLLYSLDFTSLDWDEDRIGDFIRRLDYISARYPVPTCEDCCARNIPNDCTENKSQDQ